MRITAVLLALAALGGCATIRQMDSQMQMQSAQTDVMAFCARLYSDERLQPVAAFFPTFPTMEPSVEMLANKKKPDDLERTAVKIRADAFQTCSSKWQAEYIGVYGSPSHAATYDAYLSRQSYNYVRLYYGKITYGEFNREWQKTVAEFQRVMAETDPATVQANTQRSAAAVAYIATRIRTPNCTPSPLGGMNCTPK
jgi:hypothetical protein